MWLSTIFCLFCDGFERHWLAVWIWLFYWYQAMPLLWFIGQVTILQQTIVGKFPSGYLGIILDRRQ